MYSGAGDSGFFNSPDERLEVGTVDYTVYDQEMNPYYTKEAMYVYNSPDGYVMWICPDRNLPGFIHLFTGTI